jgi:GT2 family glycosyltransferase
MMDTDQIYPEDTILKMLSHNKNVVSAPVHRRYPPFDLILFRGVPGDMVPVPDEERYCGKLIEVDSTGTGCILYNTEIFLRIDQPWFEAITENGLPVGEDVNFCRKLKKIGEPVYVDTSIKIPHLATVEINRVFYELYKFAHKNAVEMQNKIDAGARTKNTAK